jgi:phosphate starvation-inducible PhoH-like protein
VLDENNKDNILILKYSFTPINNKRLQNLCGSSDTHIALLARELDVRISHRNEQFLVEGTKARTQRAIELLQALYEMAVRPIAPEQILLMLTSGDLELSASPTLSTRCPDLKPMGKSQARYLDNIADYDVTFGIGPAGTGKTYLAVAAAVDALRRSSVQRIVLTRPVVEAGERLGYLPGGVMQKTDPYFRPLYDALHSLMGADQVQKAFERQTLEIAPLAFMRGRTLSNSFVILDEAQNTTPEQMIMFLTRIGFGSKAVVTGDLTQIDLPKQQPSGLLDAQNVLQQVKEVAFTYFTSHDVVRHPLVASIAEAYELAHSQAKDSMRQQH